MATLRPQAALETAVLNALVAQLEYTAGSQVDRTFDERPAPRCGQFFVSVWAPGRRDSQSRVALDEVHQVFVTVTVRAKWPFDRSVAQRDQLEGLLDDIRAVIHQDPYNANIMAQANSLAGYDTAEALDVGFVEGLAFLGLDDWQLVGGDWFHAQNAKECGIKQTARFGQARHIQYQSDEE